MRVLSLLIFILFLAGKLHCQHSADKAGKIDSLNKKLKADSLHTYRFKKFRPFLAIDNRASFIRDNPVNFKGLQLGIILYENHTMGFGFYNINQNSKKQVRTIDNSRTINQYLTLNYTTTFYSYAFIEKKYFEINLPVEIGFGRYRIQVEDSATGKMISDKSAGIVPIGAGVELVIKPIRWIGISSMGGYRYVRENSRINFNGWYYSIGLWIDIRQIYRDIKFYGFQKKKHKRAVKEILEK
jgi:hypothetical protein